MATQSFPLTSMGERVESLIERAFSDACTLVSERRLDLSDSRTSTITSVEVEWKSKKELPSRFVVKLPTIDKVDDVGDIPKNATFDSLTFGHNRECLVYELFARLPPPIGLRIPKVYFSEPRREGFSCGVLIMEDFSEVAKPLSVADDLTLGQLRGIVGQLAELHAYSLRNPSWNRNGEFHPVPRWYLEQQIDESREYAKKLRDEKRLHRFGDEEIDRVCDLEKILSLIHSENRSPIMNHGDFLSKNFLFHTDAEGAPTDQLAAIIDWQFAYAGPPMEDFGLIMATCVAPELRRAHQYELIDEYYAKLRDLLHGDTIPFSIDYLKAQYGSMLQYGIALVLLHIVSEVFADSTDPKTFSMRAKLLHRLEAGIEDVLQLLSDNVDQ